MRRVVRMSEIVVRDMQHHDEYFVSTCSHVNESEEIDACARRRRVLLGDLVRDGALVKAALLDGVHVGFAYGIPIERSSWGPIGRNLMVIPCLYVMERGSGRGVGRELIEAIEDATRRRELLGTTIMAFRDLPGAEWFMPASYFERLDYQEVDRRGRYVLLWKPFAQSATAPRLLEPVYTFEPVLEKVVVDLFWNGFCGTSDIEAQRVREVCAEFGSRVELRESCAEDHDALLACGIPRAIYVNGREIGWGYEALRDGIRRAIQDALAA